jgi:hypothetical protein
MNENAVYARHPARVAEVSRVHLDEPSDETGPKPAAPADLVRPA